LEIEIAIEKLKRSPSIDKFQPNWLKQEVIHYILRSQAY
jgi:hypothetical protein